MSTKVLPNPASMQQEVEGCNEVEEEVQCDSLREQNNQLLITDLRQQLIDIDEEVAEEELERLKFLCRDHITSSKLSKMTRALDVFDMMKKMVLIDDNNVDLLLECLGRIHRFDLVRKLGFQPDAVRSYLKNFKKLYPFRVLMMDISEDLDAKETEQIRFYLRGKIRKKILSEKESLLEIFVFLEQEGLLAHNNLDLLTKIMEAIRRGDLVDEIREYQGLQPLKRNEQGLNRNANPTVPSQLAPYRPTQGTNDRPPPAEPGQQREALAQSGSASDLARSVSAGTISVNSEENEAPDRRMIPQHLYDQIVTALTPSVVDLGIELGLTNEQLAQYQQQIPDERERTLKILQQWQTDTVDKGTIGSGLYFTLTKLGCKQAAGDLKRWMDSFNTGPATARQSSADFEPAGPPENHCASLREAQLELIRTQISQAPVDEQERDLRQFHISPNQIPAQRDVNFIENIALYQQGGQLVANAGVSRQLAPVAVPLNNFVQGQGQVMLGQQVPIAPDIQPQVVPVLQRHSEKVPDLPAYNMNKKPRGWCVIINNRDFHVVQGDNSSKEMPARNGTDKDAESIQHIFSKLGFIIRRRDNLSDTEMMNFLIDVAFNVDHTNFDCFVCCILTHGVLNYLYGSNGKLVSIKDLTGTFQTNRCTTLAGKPKLFFLQACQGRDKMTGGSEIERDMPTKVLAENETDQVERDMIPNEADFLLGYATVPGYVSFRSRNHGSWYIRKLCELLDKYASKFDLMSILVEVNREVAGANAQMDGGFYKQIPAPLVTLRKQLYFR